MKKWSILVLVTWTVLCAPMMLTQVGCKTANQAAYKTTATVQITADLAMRAWGEYVRIKQPGVKAELKVKAAFDKYRMAMVLVADAGRRFSTINDPEGASRLEFTITNASATLSDLVEVIRSFGIKL